MKNNGIIDFTKPTIITGQQYGSKICVEIDHSDLSLDELFDAFKTIAVGLGYSTESWDSVIVELADEIRENENEIRPNDVLLDAKKQYDQFFRKGDNFEDYQNRNF